MKKTINITFINQKPSAGKWNISFETLLEAIKNVSNAQWLDCNQMKTCRLAHHVAGMAGLAELGLVNHESTQQQQDDQNKLSVSLLLNPSVK